MSVSAIIPAFNAGRTLRRAIESVLRQTHPIEEIIVVDDGSSDATLKIAKSFAPGVRCISQSNSGVAAARNAGAAAAAGRWLAFLDADDYWLPHKSAAQVALAAAEPEVVLLYGSFQEFDNQGPTRSMPAHHPRLLWPELRFHNPLATSTVMLRRDVFVDVGGFDESLRHCEDWDLWVRCLARGRFACTQEPVMMYENLNAGLSSDSEKNLEGLEKILDRTLLTGLSGWQRRVWRRKIRSWQMMSAGITARNADPALEFHFLRRSVLEWPFPTWEPRRFRAFATTLRNRIVR